MLNLASSVLHKSIITLGGSAALLMMLAASFWIVALIQSMYPPDFCLDYADFVLTSASVSYEHILFLHVCRLYETL